MSTRPLTQLWVPLSIPDEEERGFCLLSPMPRQLVPFYLKASLLQLDFEFLQRTSSAFSQQEFTSLEVPKLSPVRFLVVPHHMAGSPLPEIWPPFISLATFSPPCLVPHSLGMRNPPWVLALFCFDNFAHDNLSPWNALPLIHPETLHPQCTFECHFLLCIHQAVLNGLSGCVCHVHLYLRESLLCYQNI